LDHDLRAVLAIVLLGFKLLQENENGAIGSRAQIGHVWSYRTPFGGHERDLQRARGDRRGRRRGHHPAPKTRWLLLNSPSNPTGASYTKEEYRALADVLAKHPHIMVMTDEIYEHIRFDGKATPHLLLAAPELRNRVLAVNGVSKTYAMTGWRIGWVAGPSSLIAALDTLLSQSAGTCCAISQPGGCGGCAEWRSVVHRRERCDLQAAPRQDHSAPECNSRVELSTSRRRLLSLHQLCRPYRQDDGGR
jgi:hypothetical protein